jgi:membrane-bound metal-dependent hydrolase YbcI (DUF457 family)
VLGFLALRWVARRVSIPDVLHWKGLGLLPVSVGGAAGAYSHVVLDSIMHSDMKPFAPFTNANPLLHVVPLGTLYLVCVGAGLVGACIIGIRLATLERRVR